MKKIIKKDIVDFIHNKYQELNRNQIKGIVDSFIEYLVLNIENEDEFRIELRGFGVLEKIRRKNKKVRNPKTNEYKEYEDVFRINFRVGRELKKYLKR